MPAQFHTGLQSTGTLQLQVCANCGQVNYPNRELCGRCLADALSWQPVTEGGVVQTLTELHYSLEPVYAAQLPWPVASVKLDCGPIVFAHLQPGLAVDSRVNVRILADREGNNMLVALPVENASTADWLEKVKFSEET